MESYSFQKKDMLIFRLSSSHFESSKYEFLSFSKSGAPVEGKMICIQNSLMSLTLRSITGLKMTEALSVK